MSELEPEVPFEETEEPDEDEVPVEPETDEELIELQEPVLPEEEQAKLAASGKPILDAHAAQENLKRAIKEGAPEDVLANLRDIADKATEKAAEYLAKRNEQMLERLDKEGERHRKRLAEILEEEALNLEPCMLCRTDLAGFLDKTAAIPEEVKAAVRVQIGDKPPRNLLKDPYSETCATCGGEKVVLSGAHEHPDETLVCVDCGGKGWTPVGPKRGGSVAVQPVAATAADGALAVGPDAPPLPDIPPEISERFVLVPRAPHAPVG